MDVSKMTITKDGECPFCREDLTKWASLREVQTFYGHYNVEAKNFEEDIPNNALENAHVKYECVHCGSEVKLPKIT